MFDLIIMQFSLLFRNSISSFENIVDSDQLAFYENASGHDLEKPQTTDQPVGAPWLSGRVLDSRPRGHVLIMPATKIAQMVLLHKQRGPPEL